MRNQQPAKLDPNQATSHTSVATKAPPRPHALADYQSENELAEELERSSRTLARWRAARIGPPYVVIGRRVFYRRTAVAEWLLKRERGGFEERKGRGWAGKRGA
jgi:hypothetical protein